MENQLSQDRKWYDKKRFVLPLMFFCFPFGLIPLWMGNSFNKGGKIGLTIVFCILMIGGIFSGSNNTNNHRTNQTKEKFVGSSDGVVQFNEKGEEMGRVDNEKGADVSMEIVSQNFMAKEKAAFDVRLTDRATISQLTEIANTIKEEHPDYKRYFITYYLPNDKVGSGAWATTHFNPDLEVTILGLSYSENEKLEKAKVKFKGEKIGKWKIEMRSLSNIAVISKLENGTYLFTDLYKDGSSGEKELTKKGDKYIYKNDFGEYYKIEKDGKLAHYSENGKFAVYEKIE